MVGIEGVDATNKAWVTGQVVVSDDVDAAVGCGIAIGVVVEDRVIYVAMGCLL